MRFEIAIVGCGTAGAAAAVFLARAGHAVTVYERVPDPGPVGAGIVLQPTGQAVLARLGLLPAIAAKAARLEGLLCVNTEGRTIVDLSYASLSECLFGLGLHRGVLFEELFAAVKAERIDLRLGVSASDVARVQNDRLVVLDSDGTRRGPYDLLIVADGARSQLSDPTRLMKTIRPYPWGALWFVARDPDEDFSDRLHQTVRGTQRMLGLLPTGLGPGGTSQVRHVSLFWSIRCDAFDAWRRAGLGPWKEEILRYRPEALPVLDQIEHESQVLMASYFDVTMRRWHAHNVVYLGDAAHAMSPQLGQGCNLALWDAMTLADCIDAAPSLQDALAAYSAARADHLDFYQFATRWLTPFFQSDMSALTLLRDYGMGAMTKVPFFNREMVRVMSGIKLGVVGKSLELSPRDRE